MGHSDELSPGKSRRASTKFTVFPGKVFLVFRLFCGIVTLIPLMTNMPLTYPDKVARPTTFSTPMKQSPSLFAVTLLLACLMPAGFIATADARQARPAPATRLPTAPGTPALVPAGPDAEALAKAALKKTPSDSDAAANPATATPGANPPFNVDGNFLIGPVYSNAPELTVNSNVPQGRVEQFSLDSTNSKFYNPGIARNVFGTVDPNNPKTLIVETHPITYQRTITVYIPAQYVPGAPAPFIVTHDGPGMGRPDRSLPHILDNMIAQKRLPAMLAIMVAHGGGDAQGSERGLEYDTMSGKFAEFIEAEVLPEVEKHYNVKLTKDPDGRATMGGSSGGSAALEMAWYHPDLYHRVITYSGTYVNQQWPFNPETPDGAWDFHEKLIAGSPVKPIRLWMEVGDHDLLNPNVMRDNMHDWVVANNRMATVLRAKGYHYQYCFALNAGHVDGRARSQTLPEALEYVWQGYPIK
jgi:enterochelin esterase-like enzyme